MSETDPPRRRGIPLRALIPNAVTVLALCFGLTGVRFAIGGEWEKAVAAILMAGVLDGIDGRIARLLKGTSRFGAELDSLSDVTAFGVAPTLVLYLWALQHLPGRLGWVIALAHAIACALRLARFNAQIDAPISRTSAWAISPAFRRRWGRGWRSARSICNSGWRRRSWMIWRSGPAWSPSSRCAWPS